MAQRALRVLRGQRGPPIGVEEPRLAEEVVEEDAGLRDQRGDEEREDDLVVRGVDEEPATWGWSAWWRIGGRVAWRVTWWTTWRRGR